MIIMREKAFMNKYLFIILFIIVNSFALNNIHAQVTVNNKVELQQLFDGGYLTLDIDPDTLQKDAFKIFDGEAFQFVGGSYNEISVKLIFDEMVNASKFKSHFVIFDGKYDLEIAENETDLENKNNSYSLIFSDKSYTKNKWDSVDFESRRVGALKLTARGTIGIYLGEIELFDSKQITSLAVDPSPIKLIPDGSIKLDILMVDTEGKTYPYTYPNTSIWRVENSAIASFKNENTELTGNTVGQTEVIVSVPDLNLEGSARVNVLSDFSSIPAQKKVVKVAVVYQDPVVGMGTKLHQRFNWGNPKIYVNEIIKEYKNISHGVIEFQIVETYDDDILFTTIDGEYYTPALLVQHYTQWDSIKKWAEKDGRIKFDYKGMLEHYNFYEKRELGLIDEVWVYGPPFAGMYESQMAGKEAFWYNSPPILDVPESFNKLISVMGWNYERGVAEALHSVGHRAESAIRRAYGRWDVNNPNPNEWELFTRFNQVSPGDAHIGNIHFPPNGTDDYDYGNPSMTITKADNWKRFPFLFDETRSVTCSEWGCDQLGYMRWWFGHLPYFEGVKNGILNNWWHYIVDYQGAVELAKNTPVVSDVNDEFLPLEDFHLFFNYPNPFNPSTTISYEIKNSGRVTLKIFNILGEHIETLLNNEMKSGRYEVRWNAENFASGIYLCRISYTESGSMNENVKSIKMLLVK